MPVLMNNKALAVLLIAAINVDSKVKKRRREVWTENWVKIEKSIEP